MSMPLRNNIGSINYFDEHYVYCPICSYMATVKPTKTGKMMLRCNSCSMLMFANASLSQQYLQRLPRYDFRKFRL
jgi:translation initiation factor 2 beta subunit (eIF-2beta)/eIF-5